MSNQVHSFEIARFPAAYKILLQFDSFQNPRPSLDESLEVVAGSHRDGHCYLPLQCCCEADAPFKCVRPMETVPDIEALREKGGVVTVLQTALSRGDAVAFSMHALHAAPGTYLDMHVYNILNANMQSSGSHCMLGDCLCSPTSLQIILW